MINETWNFWLLLKFATDLLICSILIKIAIVDYKKQIIPDKLNLYIFLTGLFYASFLGISFFIGVKDLPLEGHFKYFMLERLTGILVLPGLMLLANLIMKGAFGGGDIKLAFAIGMACGLKNGGDGILFGILMSGFCGMILLITRKKNLKDRFPLGPFLSFGTIVNVFEFWI